MDEDSSRLKTEMSGWSNLLCSIVGWEYPSLGLQVNLLQDSYGNGIYGDPVGLWLGSELGSPLGYLLDYDTWIPVGLQLIVEIPTGSKVRYPDLVGSTSQATLAVTPSGSCPKFPLPPYGTCLNYTSQAMIAVTLSGLRPTLPWRCGNIWHYHKLKGDKKLEIKLEGLVGLLVFVVSTLSLWHMIVFQMVF